MNTTTPSRRRFIKGAVVGAAIAGANSRVYATSATLESPGLPSSNTAVTGSAAPIGYTFLRPAEADLVEALVDHMIPADSLTPSGTALGISQYFDRALGGNWGSGDRLYLEGPWKIGTPSQGYQLSLTPAEFFRAGSVAFDAYCLKHEGKPFATLNATKKESILLGLQANTIVLDDCPDPHRYFTLLHQLVVEGLFADPAYGGNADKAGWRMVGFPGVIATHADDIERFVDRRFVAAPLSITDAS